MRVCAELVWLQFVFFTFDMFELLISSYIVVRFLVLVTTMVTKVDHSSTFPSFSYYDGNHG